MISEPARGDIPEREPSLFGVPLVRFLLGTLLFVALLQVRRDLAVLCLLLLGLMALTRHWSRFSLSAVRFASVLSQDRAFPGDPLHLRVTTENTRLLPLWLQIRWSAAAGAPSPSPGASVEEVCQCGLFGHQKVSFRWELTAPRRGVHDLGRPGLRVADPLGFFPREMEPADAHELVVYPRRVPLRALPIPHRDFFGLPGTDSPVQDPIYILGTRDYQHTQSARHIHWKASARHQRLQEKVFEPSHQAKVLLLLDVESFVRAETAEEFEQTLEVVGSLALDLDRKGCAVGMVSDGVTASGPSGFLPVARSPRQAQALLEILARLTMKSASPLLSVLQQGLTLPRGLSCVHFAQSPDALQPGLRSYLLQRRIPLVEVVAAEPVPGDPADHHAGRRRFRLAEVASRGEARP